MSAPLRLTTLGSLDLRHEKLGSVSTLVAQPKRFALLAYLAVEHHGDFCSRDALLALFWPESDEQRARASLRQALQFLRRALGEAGVRTRGDDAVGIDPDTVHTDVAAFRAAAAAGAHADAIGLYRGAFLPGLAVDDAPAFDLWQSAQREKLRRQAMLCAQRAADAASDLNAALKFAELATEIAPEDEPAARRLATLHQQAGNRGAALGTLERLREWLGAELGVEPSAETAALEQMIRSPAAPAFVQQTEHPPARQESDGERPIPVAAVAAQPAAVPASTRRRPWRWGVAAAGIAALAYGVSTLARSGSGPNDRVGASAERSTAPRIVVMPFEDRTGDARFAAVGSMVADWITGGLSAVNGLTVVPLAAVRTSARALSPQSVVRDSVTGDSMLQRVATDVGATIVVRGVAYRTGNMLHLQAHMADVRTGALLRPSESVSVPLDSVMTGIDRLRTRVVAALVPLGDTVSHLRRASPPPSYDAYRAYVDGIELFVQGDPAGALNLFEQAAREDPSYAMPRIAASIMLLNLERADDAERMLQAVQPRMAALAPLERATFDMVQGMMSGNLAAVDLAAREQARIAPGTLGEYMVAEVARRRGRPAEALRVLRRLGPDHGELRGWRPYWRELTGALHMQGDYVAEAAAARAAIARYGDEPQFHEYLVRALMALGDTAGMENVVQQRASLPSMAQPDVGTLWHTAANGALVHANAAVRAAAPRYRAREIAWFASRTGTERTIGVRWRHAQALALANQTAAARDTLAAFPEGASRDVALIGLRGAVMAMLANESGVARAHEQLDAIQRARSSAMQSMAEGDVDYWHAVIASQSGDAEQAAAALRRAFSGWRGRDVTFDSDPWFAPVRESAAFRLLRHSP